VNRSTKLFLAAAVLACGYGAATLLGTPQRPLLASSRFETPTPASGPAAESAIGVLSSVGAVRLLPDPSSDVRNSTVPSWPAGIASTARRPATNPDVATTAPDRPRAALPEGTVSQPASANAVAEPGELRPKDEKPTVTARFRDTSPKPIRDVNGRGREEIATTPAPFAAPPDAAPLQSERPKPPMRLPEVQASFQQFSETSKATVKPVVEWEAVPSLSERPAERTHIIVDGDSLPKLARRYLNDPERGAEIFELNRGVLSSPELLPIGAELKIPSAAREGGLVD
jgi:nucleoid-associated protein YgaU